MTADDLDDYIASEGRARIQIDDMLTRSRWVVQVGSPRRGRWRPSGGADER